MPATADDVAPNEWECRVFIAVAEQGTYLAAAAHLSRQIGRSYTRRAVNQVMKKMTSGRLSRGAGAVASALAEFAVAPPARTVSSVTSTGDS